jgi:hypothetical protein
VSHWADEVCIEVEPPSEEEWLAWSENFEAHIRAEEANQGHQRTQMGLTAKTGGTTVPVEAGTWPAVCPGYADLGTQASKFGTKRKVMIFWDIPDQRIDVERNGRMVSLPRRISRRFTLSLGKRASLRAMLEAWRGRAFTEEELKGFDLDKIVGAPCLLNVTHDSGEDGSVYANVQTVMALPRGMAAPALENDKFAYIAVREDGAFIPPPDTLIEWVREIIMQCEEAKAARGIVMPAPTKSNDDVDDTPF